MPDPDQPSLFDPVSDQHRSAVPPTTSSDGSWSAAATTPDPGDTDLPLPPGGSSGNHDDEVLRVLRASGIDLQDIVALVTGGVDAPPLNAVDPREVWRWAERASNRMIDPRQGRRLRRAVLDLLEAQHRLDYHAVEHARQVRHAADVAAARAAGTYWRDRDARRSATRPVHVDVDRETWAALKVEALCRRRTLGQLVGDLVQAEVDADGQTIGHRPSGPSDPRGQPGQGRRATVFARIAVEDDKWDALKALALQRRLTIARALGLVIEHAVAAR